MCKRRITYAFIFGLGIYFSSLPVYAIDSCQALFESGRNLRIDYETLSDRKKIRLIEVELQRKLSGDEVSILLDAIHLQLAPSLGSGTGTENNPYYHIKFVLTHEILPQKSFDKLFANGVLNSKPQVVSRDEVLQIIEYGQSLGLGASEVKLINQYSADLYYDINRGVDPSTKAKLLNAARKLPGFNGTTYRSADSHFPQNVSVGQVVGANSFWSTSIDREIVNNWMDGSRILAIESSSGKKLGPFARYPSESEVLILPGSRFVVTKVVNNVIYLSDLPSGN